MEITQELLKDLFHYEDGKLFNRTKRSGGALSFLTELKEVVVP